MDTLKDVKKQINSLGIRRCKFDPFVFDTALNWFIEISNEMLKRKDEKFDYDNVKDVIDFIINWTYLQTDDINFNKGFLLKGKTGRGKSFPFRIWKYFLKIDNIRFQYNGNLKFLDPYFINVKQISGEYQSPLNGGYEIIKKYSNIPALIIDDIGKEQELSRNFGNSINIVEEIISNREENNMLTFGTTNLDKISDNYDDRTVSRMNNLFTPIPLNHDIDYRINPNKL